MWWSENETERNRTQPTAMLTQASSSEVASYKSICFLAQVAPMYLRVRHDNEENTRSNSRLCWPANYVHLPRERVWQGRIVKLYSLISTHRGAQATHRWRRPAALAEIFPEPCASYVGQQNERSRHVTFVLWRP